MAISRPTHLAHRQISGRAFGETATLIRTPASVSATGRVSYGDPTSTSIDCSSRPLIGEEQQLDASGARVVGGRAFLVDPALGVKPITQDARADQIEHDDTTYTVVEVKRWGAQDLVFAERDEVQS